MSKSIAETISLFVKEIERLESKEEKEMWEVLAEELKRLREENQKLREEQEYAKQQAIYWNDKTVRLREELKNKGKQSYCIVERHTQEIKWVEKQRDKLIKGLLEIADSKKDMSGVLARVNARRLLKEIGVTVE